MATPVPSINDGSDAPPRLRRDLNIGTTWLLPEWSEGPRGDQRAVHEAIAAAGYEGVQGGDVHLCHELGLAATTFGIVRELGALDEQAHIWADVGFECCTLHVGTGLEDDDEAHALVEEVLDVSERHGILYIETHRATITQDIFRTVRLARRYPELAFNGDFSHWYTGLEMTYGDFDAKVEFATPVLERTRFFHGRIGTSGAIQVDVGDGDEAANPTVSHFTAFWTAAMAGFVAAAGPGDVLPFAPELLPAEIGYARLVPDREGGLREEGDRWTQAAVLGDIAADCFAAAESGPAVEA